MDKINFILDNLPDLYNKEQESNLYKVLNPIAKELDLFVSKIDDVRKSNFVDMASSDDLDKLAKLLNVKRFNNEADDSFRARIKSKVPSFIGGGTASALKQVVNNYLGVEPIIIEHYNVGEGHVEFDNGVLNGLALENINATSVRIKSGVGYIQGSRFNLNDTTQTITTGDQYIKYNLFANDYKTKADFVGKVSGSTVENPHIYKIGESNPLPAPTLYGTERPTANYTALSTLNGITDPKSVNSNGLIASQLFSFDFITHIERNHGKIPAVDIAGKVAWLKSNINKIICNWHGKGSGPNGNKANFTNWRADVSEWAAPFTHANATISKISLTLSTNLMNYRIDLNGFVHFLAYADASNGTIASIIETDYIELEVYMKASSYVTVETDNIQKNNQALLGKRTNGVGKANFVSKISGSVVENPHKFLRRGSTVLDPPSSFSTENTDSAYANISSLNGIVYSYSASINAYYALNLFSFNLIEYIQRKYNFTVPGATTADKVTWLKANITKITCNWWGYGSGPNGNKATLLQWYAGNGTPAWGTPLSHNNSTITKISSQIGTNHIDSNGFVYFLAHTDASNGTIDSTINTDYIELEIETTAFFDIIDSRTILNPEEHYITNTASITVQIPYSFDASNISLEDVKDILRNTKAAGIALLIKVMESYTDTFSINEKLMPYFLVGFSGIGSNNLLGGQ